jgi:hypothetical protein
MRSTCFGAAAPAGDVDKKFTHHWRRKFMLLTSDCNAGDDDCTSGDVDCSICDDVQCSTGELDCNASWRRPVLYCT